MNEGKVGLGNYFWRFTLTNTVNSLLQDSGNVHYYTPALWTSLARQVMGSIELDPASAETANEVVGAERFFTESDNGLAQDWKAKTLWMNHPFSKGEKACKTPCKKSTCVKRGHCITEDLPSNIDWISKLSREYASGNVTEALNICFASTSEAWFKPLLSQPQCYIHGRVNYVGPDGRVVQGCTKGSVVTYWGNNVERFAEVFQPYGTIKVEFNANK